MKPTTERVAAFRARKAAAGESEIRGIFAPKPLHPAIKQAVKYMVAMEQQKNSTDPG
jgi:hypothetical protein